jgi:hypothetical protein
VGVPEGEGWLEGALAVLVVEMEAVKGFGVTEWIEGLKRGGGLRRPDASPPSVTSPLPRKTSD